MAAWNDAVLINSVASYSVFLDQYPDSDLTPTARKLIERLRNRPVVAAAVAAVSTNAPQSTPLIPPTNVALGPTCPCTPVPLPIKKAVPAEDPHDVRQDVRQDVTTYSPVQRFKFDDDEIVSDVLGPDEIRLWSNRPAAQPSLIEIRQHFVPEMVKSLEEY